MDWKEIIKITGIPVLIASLCCVTPIVLVLFGLSTLTFASSLSDTLYGEYKWIFRIFGLLFLLGSLFIYFRRKGICTLDQAKRQKQRVINIVLISLIVSIIAYVIWLYVIVHYFGVFLKIWS